MSDLLSIQHISKSYASHPALADVSMSVPVQSIFGILGPNGAGKSTLLRIISRISAPDSGQVFFAGELLSEKHNRCIGYLPEERGLYKKMEAGEQALFFARLKGMSRKEAMKNLRFWFEKFGIESWWNRKIE